MKMFIPVKYLFVLFLLFTFILGIVFCLSKNNYLFEMENMATIDESTEKENTCPNVLIRQGGILLLYNTLQSASDTNPISFSNLDNYIAYVRSQRDKGVRCPVLYIQEETNAQGEDVYRIRNSPFSIEGGLPTKVIPIKPADASRQNPPYNQGQYHGFDPYSQYAGKYTILDQIHDSTRQVPISDNPMDPNWGGVIHSQQMIDSGKYDENTVGKPLMVPRTLVLQP
jgi:hypothetical protein